MAFDVEEITLRSGTSADWAGGSAPLLDAGELGLDLTTGEARFGDGTTAWAGLRTLGHGKMGTTGALVAGVKVVNDSRVTANSVFRLIPTTVAGVALPVAYAVTARVAGTSFTVTSGSASDTSTLSYEIIEP